MTPSSAAPSLAALAAAKARHPAGRLLEGAGGPPLSFAGAVALLTGPWRVNDPVGFAAAMTAAPAVAGHAVTDLSTSEGEDLAPAVAAIAPRRRLRMWWVAGSAAGQFHVEARAEAAAGREGPEVFVLAHLVEPLGVRSGQAIPADHSWLLLVIGDGSGGVAAVARATVACPRRPRCCPPPVPALRFPLAALRVRLLSPALEAEATASRPPAPVRSLPART